MAVETICAECGATIKRSPSNLSERNFCDKNCLGAYRSRHYVGDRSAHWKGGVRLERGRVLVHRPDHPDAQQSGYIYRYRLVAEQMLGRRLKADEVVHHIDGDETNDDPGNLLVMGQAEHASRYDARRRARGVIPERCAHGHRLDNETLYIHRRDGLTKWTCKVCRREAGRRHDAKRRSRGSHHATV
jgi:hypothetical protein